jgi:hypothetical protein
MDSHLKGHLDLQLKAMKKQIVHLVRCRSTEGVVYLRRSVYCQTSTSGSRLQVRRVHCQRYYYGIYHIVRSIFYRLFSIASSNNEMTLSLATFESMAPNLEGIFAKDSLASLFMSHHV